MRREAEFEQPLKKDAFVDGTVNSRVLSFLLGYSCRLVSQNMALILLKEASLDVSSFSKVAFDIITLYSFFSFVSTMPDNFFSFLFIFLLNKTTVCLFLFLNNIIKSYL